MAQPAYPCSSIIRVCVLSNQPSRRISIFALSSAWVHFHAPLFPVLCAFSRAIFCISDRFSRPRVFAVSVARTSGESFALVATISLSSSGVMPVSLSHFGTSSLSVPRASFSAHFAAHATANCPLVTLSIAHPARAIFDHATAMTSPAYAAHPRATDHAAVIAAAHFANFPPVSHTFTAVFFRAFSPALASFPAIPEIFPATPAHPARSPMRLVMVNAISPCVPEMSFVPISFSIVAHLSQSVARSRRARAGNSSSMRARVASFFSLLLRSFLKLMYSGIATRDPGILQKKRAISLTEFAKSSPRRSHVSCQLSLLVRENFLLSNFFRSSGEILWKSNFKSPRY